MKTKLCIKCGKTKPTDTGFYKNASYADGLYSHCAACHRETARRYEKSPRGKGTVARKTAKMAGLYPDKYKARAKLRKATRTGLIIKPKACQKCNSETRLHGHHNDYNKPLDVLWLCDICHKLIHHKLRDVSLLRRET